MVPVVVLVVVAVLVAVAVVVVVVVVGVVVVIVVVVVVVPEVSSLHGRTRLVPVVATVAADSEGNFLNALALE